MYNNSNKYFPKDFKPGPHDVLVGRGKKYYQHSGNIHFRKLVASKVDMYLASSNRREKTDILKSIVSSVRQKSGANGGFLKQDHKTGLWFEVGDFLARERTSQAFRDATTGHGSSTYKSSTTFKKKMRQMKKTSSKEEISKVSANSIKEGESNFNYSFEKESSSLSSNLVAAVKDPLHEKTTRKSSEPYLGSATSIFDDCLLDSVTDNDIDDLESTCSYLHFEDLIEDDPLLEHPGSTGESQQSTHGDWVNKSNICSNDNVMSFASVPCILRNATLSV